MDGEKGLLVVDVQNDFCPGGALAVPKGDEIIPLVNSLMPGFPVVVATQDWHPEGHISFASSHRGKDPFETISLPEGDQVLWPDHCVQGSEGAELHSGLETKWLQAIVRKGMDPRLDSYSGFRDNSQTLVTGLSGYLKSRGVQEIYLVGLATDYCVHFSGMDGREEGFEVTIILDGTRGIDQPPGSMKEKLAHFRKAGGRVIDSAEL